MAKTKSILHHGYIAAVLAELKRDAGKSFVWPTLDCYGHIWNYHGGCFGINVSPQCKAVIEDVDYNGVSHTQSYTPARFRAALRKIKKQKGGEK